MTHTSLPALLNQYLSIKGAILKLLPSLALKDLDTLASQCADQPESVEATKSENTSQSPHLKKDGTPKKKPGPKAGPKGTRSPHLKKDGTPKKKPGPKGPHGGPRNGRSSQAGANRAAEGRRAVLAKERPSLMDGIRQVMGSEVMSTQEVYDALKAKGWLPNSTDPKGYVGYTLSAHKKDFDRVLEKGRGFYRLKGNGFATPPPKAENDTAKEAAPNAPSVVSEGEDRDKFGRYKKRENHAPQP